MDRLLVATLNILNLADRWAERLPLLLADMAALQPDLIGLQEVVYPMQQDRLLGAAGEGRYEAVRGWAGRPEYGNSLLVKAPLVATDVRAAGPRPGAVRAPRAPRAPRRLDARVRGHAPPPPARRARRDRVAQVEALLPWLDASPAHDALIVVGDFNADPREPAYACMLDARVPVRVRRGERRGAGGDLAERPAGRGDGHRRRPGLPRLRLAARRGRGRGRRASCSTGRPSATRPCTRRTTSGSPPRSTASAG